jgi:hypothetical protein
MWLKLLTLILKDENIRILKIKKNLDLIWVNMVNLWTELWDRYKIFNKFNREKK